MTARDELLRIVPPPGGVEVHVDWADVGEALGVALPDDYKWLVERYGPGSCDDFLHIFQPESPFSMTRLLDSSERAAEVLHQARERSVNIPYETDELLAVGATDNGDTIYWVTRPEDEPSSWTITVNGARNMKWPHFEGGLVELLAAVMSGARRVDVFPQVFPRKPVFSPLPGSGCAPPLISGGCPRTT
ncbi:SMI1/KNR4 family protein [Streptomyces coeruleorubidus]|uniref:SMI1/KNR4 family protein n=1 Tax=Streptomyces coeruleorubidus TaxID=116188 RepID=UPI0033A048CB